jgi:alginate O-acetyltransferase complex protein AlgI
MLFTTFNFIIFFPAVIFIYYLLPLKFRWTFLLIASYFFYINISPVYALLLFGVTITTYLFTNLISRTSSENKKKWLFIADIILTLLPLFFFKYYNFLNQSIIDFLVFLNIRWPLPNLNLLLPVGISFYTFMALGYSIDVYNEEIKPEKNFRIVALFLSFFPIVLSGPIERSKNMFHQFRGKLEFNYEKSVKGLQLVLWGYFMKLVIADRVAIYVSAIFGNFEYHSGVSLLFATLLYPIQIYCDLGGYSLIAIGCANVMGIDINPNFQRPFFSTSMSEFWRRWHMSLIKWLTDYIYTPISFSLRKFHVWGIVFALMLTFFISGIWHGAALIYIVWGVFQGILLSIEAITNRKKATFLKKYNLNGKFLYVFFSCVFTYSLFAFSLLIAGAVDSISDALTVIGKIFTNKQSLFINGTTLVYMFVGIVLLFLSELRDEFFPERFKLFQNNNIYIRWGAYLTILFIIILLGVFNGGQFIYFKF